uniref:NADH-ubiquinone oxidoreductase chain 2 n=1 Tax=Potamanthus sp. MT-2014 TaxID=1560020 RepID=A0A0A0RYT1_9INSE|nr:NADH dehydrogenase subunit 2 [Potamanthus sp. MT-2014]
MLYNPTRLLFISTLIIGTLIATSSSTWLGAWIGLEINLLSFIPLMTQNNQFAAEAALKYFLVQALASAMLLFAILLSFILAPGSMSALPPTILVPLGSALFLKMGAAPFHFWFPGVMEGLSWYGNLILMTWQKIAPIMLLSYLATYSLFFSSVILLSILAGSLGGLNQTSLRKIMAYSSINHLGWMIAASVMGDNFWLMYFSFYSFLSLIMVLIFNHFQLSHINQAYALSMTSTPTKLLLFGNLLSLGGLPPFLGFLPKWLIIQNMAEMGLYFLITFMVTFTLITLFFYLRIAYGAYMLTHQEPKWNNQPSMVSTLTLYLSAISLLGLSLSSMIISMF